MVERPTQQRDGYCGARALPWGIGHPFDQSAHARRRRARQARHHQRQAALPLRYEQRTRPCDTHCSATQSGDAVRRQCSAPTGPPYLWRHELEDVDAVLVVDKLDLGLGTRARAREGGRVQGSEGQGWAEEGGGGRLLRVVNTPAVKGVGGIAPATYHTLATATAHSMVLTSKVPPAPHRSAPDARPSTRPNLCPLSTQPYYFPTLARRPIPPPLKTTP